MRDENRVLIRLIALLRGFRADFVPCSRRRGAILQSVLARMRDGDEPPDRHQR